MAALRTLACERCNRRKQRCDRKLPSCSQCITARVECLNGRNEANMTRTAFGSVHTKGVVEMLESRLEELETLSRKHGLQSGSQHGTTTPPVSGELREETSGVPFHGLPNSAGTGTVESSSSRDNADSREGQSRRQSPGIGLLSLTAMAEPSSRATEYLKGISMPGIISAITVSYGGNVEKTARIDALWDGIAKDIHRSSVQNPERFYIPAEDALKYVETYYRIVDYRFPHLPRDDVMRGISALTATNEAVYEATLSNDPAKVFMAYMVLGITPLVSDTYPVAQASFISIHMLSKALRILSKVFQLEDGVDIICCLRLLVIFSLHSSAAGSTWHLQGVVMKKCIALGFHREVVNPSRDTSKEELEDRRWAFWSCYFLDRLISCALDRPFSITDLNVTAQLPGTAVPSSSKLTMSQVQHVHLFRYSLLQSRIITDKGERPFAAHLSQLVHWETSAPILHESYSLEQEEHINSLCNTLSLVAMADKIVYSETECRPTEYSSSDQSSFFSLREFARCCQSVVGSISRRSMQRRSTLSWITGYSTVLACMGLLFCQSSSRRDAEKPHNEADAIEYQNNLNSALDVLSVVGRQFPVILEYRSLIVEMDVSCSKALGNTYAGGSMGPNEPTSPIPDYSFVGPTRIHVLVRKILEMIAGTLYR